MSRAWLKTLGKRIRARRKALDLSQEELGERADLHATYVSHLEAGRRNVSFITLVHVALALQLTPSQLVDDPHWSRLKDG